MKRLFAAALLAVSVQAQAATFLFTLTGTATHQTGFWECTPDCEPGDFMPTIVFPWDGLATITTPDNADGMYINPFVKFESNLVLGNFSGTYESWVSVSGGHVDSFYAAAQNMEALFLFEDFSATFTHPQLHHYGPTIATGTLASEAPEPSTYGLLLLGLLAIGLRLKSSAIK